MPSQPRANDRHLLAAALVVWAAVAAIGVAIGPPLGHDEAAFAIVARGDAPVAGWLYRSEGTVVLARLGVALGGADWQLRLASALASLALVIAAFAVGRAAFTARTGAWAAALVAGAHPMALRSAQLLSDLPAAACLVGGIAVLVGELDRAAARAVGPRWRIVLTAPLFAAAFYLRYGSAPVIGLALAAAGLFWWRAVLARPLRALATVAALAALLVPHLVQSRGVTGAALGILEVSAGMPRRAYVGEGLVTYLTSNPFVFYGALIAPVMIAGLLGLARVRRRAPWYLALVALGQLVVLGLQSHGQPRYVFVAAVLLLPIGVDVVARLAGPDGPTWLVGRGRRAWPGPAWSRLALAVVAASWLHVAVAQVVVCREAARSRAPILDAARVIRRDAGGRPCAAVALLAPQLTWYSGCQVYPTMLPAAMPADRARYAAWFTRWPIDLAAVLAAQSLRATPIASEDPDARIWRLD
jgi:hypothetical protein